MKKKPDYVQTTATQDLGETCVPADIPEAAQEPMVKQQATDWVPRRPRTTYGDVILCLGSNVETQLEGARSPEDMVTSREDVGRHSG